MSVEFYYMPESPPCRCVEMLANMAGVTLNKHYVNLFTGDQKKDDYVKMNPSGKIPFIVDGDLKIGESRAIMAYLVDKFKPVDLPGLYPQDVKKRALIDEMLFFDASGLYVSGSKLIMPLLHGHTKDFDPEAEKEFRAKLSFLENKLGENKGKFMLGDHLTIADIAIVTTLSFVQAFDFDYSAFKLLLAYLESARGAIPDYGKINDEPTENLKKFVKSKQEAK